MAHPLQDHIDKIIAAATENGSLETLPGQGKPLDLSRDPLDAMVGKVMAEHRVKPPVVVLKEKVAAAQAALAKAHAPDARKAKMAELADLQTRLALEMEALRRGR